MMRLEDFDSCEMGSSSSSTSDPRKKYGSEKVPSMQTADEIEGESGEAEERLDDIHDQRTSSERPSKKGSQGPLGSPTGSQGGHSGSDESEADNPFGSAEGEKPGSGLFPEGGPLVNQEDDDDHFFEDEEEEEGGKTGTFDHEKMDDVIYQLRKTLEDDAPHSAKQGDESGGMAGGSMDQPEEGEEEGAFEPLDDHGQPEGQPGGDGEYPILPEEFFRNINSPLGQGIPDDKEYGEVVLYDEKGSAILDDAGWSHDGKSDQEGSGQFGEGEDQEGEGDFYDMQDQFVHPSQDQQPELQHASQGQTPHFEEAFDYGAADQDEEEEGLKEDDVGFENQLERAQNQPEGQFGSQDHQKPPDEFDGFDDQQEPFGQPDQHKGSGEQDQEGGFDDPGHQFGQPQSDLPDQGEFGQASRDQRDFQQDPEDDHGDFQQDPEDDHGDFDDQQDQPEQVGPLEYAVEVKLCDIFGDCLCECDLSSVSISAKSSHSSSRQGLNGPLKGSNVDVSSDRKSGQSTDRPFRFGGSKGAPQSSEGSAEDFGGPPEDSGEHKDPGGPGGISTGSTPFRLGSPEDGGMKDGPLNRAQRLDDQLKDGGMRDGSLNRAQRLDQLKKRSPSGGSLMEDAARGVYNKIKMKPKVGIAEKYLCINCLYSKLAAPNRKYWKELTFSDADDFRENYLGRLFYCSFCKKEQRSPLTLRKFHDPLVDPERNPEPSYMIHDGYSILMGIYPYRTTKYYDPASFRKKSLGAGGGIAKLHQLPKSAPRGGKPERHFKYEPPLPELSKSIGSTSMSYNDDDTTKPPESMDMSDCFKEFN